MVSLSTTPIITENATQTISIPTHSSYAFGFFIPGLSIPTRTVEDEDSTLETEVELDEQEPHFIFPMGVPCAYEVPIYHKPQYVDHWPVGFLATNSWENIWNGREHDIELYLHKYRDVRTGASVPWRPETNFKGARWRLKTRNVSNMPVFKEGMIISFRHCNEANFRYIVDHVAFKDQRCAYLKVFCFRADQFVCDIWTPRPPIILEIPVNHCNVRGHPNQANFNVPHQTTRSTKKSLTLWCLIRSAFQKIQV